MMIACARYDIKDLCQVARIAIQAHPLQHGRVPHVRGQPGAIAKRTRVSGTSVCAFVEKIKPLVFLTNRDFQTLVVIGRNADIVADIHGFLNN